MRLGEKSKKAIRIGSKLLGAGVVVAGGARLASKAGDPNQPLVGSYSVAEETIPRGTGLPTLVGKTGELRSGAQDFASLATQLAQQRR